MPPLDPAAAGSRRPGRSGLRPGSRVPERAGERARQRIPVGQLRVPRERRRLPRGRGRRGGAAQAGDLGCLRLVVVPDDWRRFVAPAAFLLAATIAVVLIRSGLESGGTHTRGSSGAPRKHVVATTTSSTTAKRPTKRFWVVRAGDTFAVISSKSGVPVATTRAPQPEGELDLALHRREDPAQVRLAVCLPSSSRPAALPRLRSGGRAARARCGLRRRGRAHR